MNLAPRTFLLAALVALLGIVEQWAAPAGFGSWRVAASLLVIGLLYEWLWVRRARLEVSVVRAGPLALGRDERLTLRFDNSGNSPLTVVFTAALPPELRSSPEPWTMEVAAGSGASADVLARPLALGKHDWDAVPMRVRGPLRLAWWSRRQRLGTVVEVVPDVLRSPARSPGSMARGDVHSTLAGGGSELHHLREYRRGDSRHTIDWKATARTGSPVTRVYGEDQHLEIMMLLDAGRTGVTEIGGLSQLGHFVNAAARFVERAAAVEDRVGMVAVADRLLASVPARRGMPGVLGIRRALAGLAPLAVETDLLRGALEVQRMVHHRALVVILTDLYGQDTGGSLARSVRLMLPRHLPVVVTLVGEEVAAMAHQPARRWIDPYRSLAAREYRTRVWRNAAALRSLGAQTVVTAPGALDARVLTLYQTLRLQRRI